MIQRRMIITILSICIVLLLISLGIYKFTFDKKKETDAMEKSTVSMEELVHSPDGKVGLIFRLSSNGTPQYEVSFNGTNVIEPSQLGFQLRDQEPLQQNFEIINTSIEEFEETWEPVWGEKQSVENHYKQLTVHLQEKDKPNRKMDVEFRVFNDGVGFRYILPKQENLSGVLQITSEDTEFKLADNNTSWWIPKDWDSYEYNYEQTPLNEVFEVHTPFTMKTPEGIHITIHEAALVDYAGMALKRSGKNTLTSILAPWPNSEVKVIKESYPVITPWRTIQIGENAGALVESDLIENLNDPNVLADTSWITPMKYVGIWWEMHIDKSTWASGDKHGATTENAKRYIDFAHQYLDSKQQDIGLLVEGWNIGWDGNWMDNGHLFDFTKAYPDFDLEEVVQYGKERGVHYIAHNETSGDIINYETQVDEAYSLYENLGISAIKSGYVADNGMRNPEGYHHHGQYMVNHYLHTIKKAAEHKIMLNIHEPIKSTGLVRTYPNWVSSEGVMGMEYNAWSAGHYLSHLTTLPFTRMMAGPIDYTPGIFDVEIAGREERVPSTRAQQLALYVIITSGAQMVTDLPENYLDAQGEILPEFKFIKDVPVTWDDIIVPNAEIGDYVTIVRRCGEEWYIGSITDEETREITIPLGFLENGQQYVAEIYSDGEEAHWEKNPTPVDLTKVIVNSEDTLIASLAAGGGQAVRIYPATEEEQGVIPQYSRPNVKITFTELPTTIQANDVLDIHITFENDGNVLASKKVEMQIDDETVVEETIRIAPQTQKEVQLIYDKLFELGDYSIKINNEIKNIKVTEKEPSFEYSDFRLEVASNTIIATATVKNLGSSTGTVDVPLYINGEQVETQTVEVHAKAGGGTKTVRFSYKLPTDIGIYEVSIGNHEPVIVALPVINLSGNWLFKQGDAPKWKDMEFDDSDWSSVTLPSSWETHSQYTADNVYGWYRKKIHIPIEWNGYSLKITLGKIDDVDVTYFNGEKIGQSGVFPSENNGEGMETAWEKVREYVIPASAIKFGEENIISIRVFDGTGGGGLYEGPLNSIELIK
nr:glycoside hydrolase family 97 catalytic domain-containing protein [Paenibacillus bovis]